MAKNLTLNKIIKVADKAYGEDHLVLRASKGVDVGDTLATFIARELKDTFDQGATATNKLEEARRAMASASRQLMDVSITFSDLI